MPRATTFQVRNGGWSRRAAPVRAAPLAMAAAPVTAASKRFAEAKAAKLAAAGASSVSGAAVALYTQPMSLQGMVLGCVALVKSIMVATIAKLMCAEKMLWAFNSAAGMGLASLLSSAGGWVTSTCTKLFCSASLVKSALGELVDANKQVFDYVAIAPDFNARWLRLQGTRLNSLYAAFEDGVGGLAQFYGQLPPEVRGALGASVAIGVFYAVRGFVRAQKAAAAPSELSAAEISAAYWATQATKPKFRYTPPDVEVIKTVAKPALISSPAAPVPTVAAAKTAAPLNAKPALFSSPKAPLPTMPSMAKEATPVIAKPALKVAPSKETPAVAKPGPVFAAKPALKQTVTGPFTKPAPAKKAGLGPTKAAEESKAKKHALEGFYKWQKDNFGL